MKIALAKSIAIVILAFLFAVHTFAQRENCDLASKQAPLLLNLQMGTSPEQAQAVFGKDLKIKIKKRGERTFFQNYIKKPAPVSLRGVRALYLRFYDRKLYQVEIFYEPRPDLAALEDIAGNLAAQFDFPVSNWTIKNNRAEIVCNELSLVTDYILNPRIELTTETVRARIEELREKDKN